MNSANRMYINEIEVMMVHTTARLRISAFPVFLVSIVISLLMISTLRNPSLAASTNNATLPQELSSRKTDWKTSIRKGEKVKLNNSDINALTQNQEYDNDYVVVLLKGSLSKEKILKFTEKHLSELQVHQKNQQRKIGGGIYVSLKVPKDMAVKAFLSDLNSDENVLYAEPSYKRILFWTPNDPDFSQQWQLQNYSTGNYGIEMPKAWDYVDTQLDAQIGAGNNYGGRSSVVVAVIDTGLGYEARILSRPGTYEDAWEFAPVYDIPLTLWTNTDEIAADGLDNDNNGYIDDYNGVNIDDYYNYELMYGGHTSEDGYPDDDYGHGTHVSEIIAGNTNNSAAGAGIAFKTQIMPIKIFDYLGGVWSESVIDALAYAIDNGADVINMSFGGSSPSTVEETIIDEAVAAAIIPVAASGNSGNSEMQFPAGYENVIAVGASNPNGTRSSYATYGNWIDLAAPVGSSGAGDGFREYNYQCYNAATQSNPLPCTQDNTYTWDPTSNSFKNYSTGASQGTSFAAPQVSGVAALLKSIDTDITFAEARYKLRMGATKMGGVRYSDQLGFGILDAYETLTEPLPTDNYDPVYRFWSENYRHHFFTISESERDNIIQNLWFDWGYEGIAYYADDSCPDGFSTLFRFWSPRYRGHFFTISEDEKNNVIQNLSYDWTYEGTAYCASAISRPDLTPVYRFWSARYHGHFYTISEAERDNIIQNLSNDWTYESIAYYVSSDASAL